MTYWCQWKKLTIFSIFIAALTQSKILNAIHNGREIKTSKLKGWKRLTFSRTWGRCHSRVPSPSAPSRLSASRREWCPGRSLSSPVALGTGARVSTQPGHNSAGRMRNNVRRCAGVKNARKMLRMATREYAEECLLALIRKNTRQGALRKMCFRAQTHEIAQSASRCTNAHQGHGQICAPGCIGQNKRQGACAC